MDNKPTNADWVRSMSDEELASFLAHEKYRTAENVFKAIGFGITEEFLYFLWLRWLKKPAEEETT